MPVMIDMEDFKSCAAASGNGNWQGSVSCHQRFVTLSAAIFFMSSPKSLPVYSN